GMSVPVLLGLFMISSHFYEFGVFSLIESIRVLMFIIVGLATLKLIENSTLYETMLKYAAKEITEYKDNIHDSDERYRILVEMAQDGVWLLDKDFMTLFVNPKMEELLGYSKEEMIGRSWYDFGDPEWVARAKELEKRREDGVKEPHEFLFIHKDGRKVLTRISTTPLYDKNGDFDGAIGILSDITRQKKTEEALNAKDVLNSIAQSAGIGMCIINPDYTIEWYNDQYVEWFGPLESTKGRSCFEVFEGNDSQCAECPTRLVFEGNDIAVSERVDITTLHGFGRSVMITATPIRDASGNVIQVVEIAQDITEQKLSVTLHEHFATELEVQVSEKTRKLSDARKALLNMVSELTASRNMTQEVNEQLELRNQEFAIANQEIQSTTEKLIDVNEKLANANERLQEVDRMKSEFLNTMSHELRTPLTAIIGYSSLLLQEIAGTINEKQENYVDGIHRSGNHLLSLINEILDLSKIEAGKMRLNIEPVNVSFIINDALITERPQADARNQYVTVDVEENIAPIAADIGRLKQVLINLVSNAIKFTPDNGKVEIRAHQDDGHIRVDISDSGIGIKDEDLSKLFKRFVQLDSKMSRQHAGTGLGLSIVDEFVKLMGGKVFVESEYGKGSTFSIRLPVYVTKEHDEDDINSGKTI
ncbi:MAG: PAS domain S-box protein, partial [Methanosarcinales archaeon]|nr:PAS domain S-box protein [Methanosarcinales archaeon]